MTKEVTPVVLTQPKKGWVDYLGWVIADAVTWLFAAAVVSWGLALLFPRSELALGYGQSFVAVVVVRYLTGADHRGEFWLLTKGSK